MVHVSHLFSSISCQSSLCGIPLLIIGRLPEPVVSNRRFSAFSFHSAPLLSCIDHSIGIPAACPAVHYGFIPASEILPDFDRSTSVPTSLAVGPRLLPFLTGVYDSVAACLRVLPRYCWAATCLRLLYSSSFSRTNSSISRSPTGIFISRKVQIFRPGVFAVLSIRACTVGRRTIVIQELPRIVRRSKRYLYHQGIFTCTPGSNYSNSQGAP